MPRKGNVRFADLRVGILVLAGIGGLIVLILGVSGDISFFKRKTTLYAELPTAEGLKNGDEVRLGGVRVGTVKNVDFTEIPENASATKAVRVTMVIDDPDTNQRIRSDSTAVLRQLGLLGGQYVDISPGTLAGDPLMEGDVVKARQETTIQQVVASSDDLLHGFQQLSEKLNEITDTINSGKGTFGRFINDESFYLNLNKVTLEAQELVRRIREGDGTAGRLINDPRLYDDIRSTVTSLQGVVGNIQGGKGTAGKLLNDEEIYNRVNSAAARLDAASARIEEITTQVASGKGTAGRLIYDEKLHQDTQAAIASMRSITERLDRGEGTAGKLLHDDQLYNNLNALSSESVKLLYDFRQNPKKYLSVKVTLF
jgi:phospholipid/cholesterol/gamma-HCH transport system substrate-binding protein